MAEAFAQWYRDGLDYAIALAKDGRVADVEKVLADVCHTYNAVVNNARFRGVSAAIP